MTAAFVCGVVVGWASLSVAAAFALAAVIAAADRREQAAKQQQPAGVVDPETGAVWTETKRLGEVWL